MFLTVIGIELLDFGQKTRRNPLKSGQCFLPKRNGIYQLLVLEKLRVAIPSNRVNVSYLKENIKLRML